MQKVFFTLSVLSLFLVSSCGGSGTLGTCTCACVIEDVGTVVDDLTGGYTESECDSAADLGGGNECGNFSDGSVVCTSSWEES